MGQLWQKLCLMVLKRQVTDRYCALSDQHPDRVAQACHGVMAMPEEERRKKSKDYTFWR